MADDHESPPSPEAAPVETLIQGRAKRSTAGLHMSALLDAAADDDLALLFEEVEDDNEFADEDEEGGEEDDMRFESSSDDDDDQGPSARDDDLEGEKQIEKEERAEKKKRRAQEDLRYKIVSKKVKIDPTAVSAVSAPRPKKKSERISWIPTLEEGPIRSSSRRQTMQNKELTHARLKDSEEKRIRLIATMEEAAKRKAKFKPKEMTQAERLAEAERVEKHNSKSLNRWEEMEKRKAEERKAKIEALQNRRLDGPVMSYWSGIATWVNGRLTRIGKVDVTPKPEKEETARRKSKKMDKEGKNVTEQKPTEDVVAAGPATSQTAPPPTQTEASTAPQTSGEGEPAKQDQDTQPQQTDSESLQKDGEISHDKGSDTVAQASASSPAATEAPAGAAAPDQASTLALNGGSGTEAAPDSDSLKAELGKTEAPSETQTTDPAPHDGKADEKMDDKPDEKPTAQRPEETPIHAAEAQQSTSHESGESSTLKSEKQPDQGPPVEEKSDDATKEAISEPSAAAQPIPETATAPQEPSPTAAPGTVDAPPQADQPTDAPIEVQAPKEAPEIHTDQPAVANEDTPQPEIPEVPSVIDQTGRCLTVLENFDDKTAQSREFSIYFNAKKPPRLTKISSSLCVITSLPSRYKDPETSLPFANSYAYNEIRHTVAQKYSWSPMLGCYVGPAGVAARGVPARFLGGADAEEEVKESEQNDNSGSNEPATTEAESETKASGGTPTASASTGPSAAPAPAPAPAPAAAGAGADAGDPMEVDS